MSGYRCKKVQTNPIRKWFKQLLLRASIETNQSVKAVTFRFKETRLNLALGHDFIENTVMTLSIAFLAATVRN